MNIITSLHDFNLPIKFSYDGFMAFIIDFMLDAQRQDMTAPINEVRYFDPFENFYVFNIQVDETSPTEVYAIFNPDKSRIQFHQRSID